MTRFFIVLAIMVIGCAPSAETTYKVIPIPAPTTTGSAVPFLFTDANDQVYLSWVEKQDTINSFKYARLQDSVWTTPQLIATGTDWFVNWADYPMIAAQGQDMIAHFLKKSGSGTFAYDVNITTSADGTGWSAPRVLHGDQKQAEHGFVTLLPYEENYLVTWLDGRNTVMEGMENMDHHEGHHGVMTLRGAMLDREGRKLDEWELDSRTCDCCQTTAAVTDKGPVVVYRDRSEEEIRDIAIVRQVNGQWTEPEVIFSDQWKIAGCPVNGPRADAIDNTLVVAWFTAADNQPAVNVIFSEDAGETFEAPIRIDAGKTIGRVDVVLVDRNSAMVSWMEGADIKVIDVQRDGKKGIPISIATSSDERSSGFPQMTKAGNQLIFAWTDAREKVIKTASVSFKVNQ